MLALTTRQRQRVERVGARMVSAAISGERSSSERFESPADAKAKQPMLQRPDWGGRRRRAEGGFAAPDGHVQRRRVQLLHVGY